MEQIEFVHAYFIKLGSQGKWEKSSIKESRARIGWGGQTVEDINQHNWDIIRKQLKKYYVGKGTQDEGVVTRDLKALKTFVESTDDDVWVTFYESSLWWCRLKGPIQEDKISKYRTLEGHWSDCSVKGNRLLINQISGKLSKIQGFRGTLCKVREKKALYRLLNNKPSEEALGIESAQESLVRSVEDGVKLLHWQDFETLVDLLFTGAGWHRLSMVGKTMKYVDIEYEEPITKDLYQIQVKSAAGVSDFMQYAKEFSPKGFKRLYFVVHSPTLDLINLKLEDKNIELVPPKHLAQMVVDLGLTKWLLKKVE